MCGPADFDALHTCITRLTQVSAAGLATYAACKTIALCRELRSEQKAAEESSPPQKGTGSELTIINLGEKHAP